MYLLATPPPIFYPSYLFLSLNKRVPSSSSSKPEFLFNKTKSIIVGRASGVCLAALQSDDFLIGLGCAFLVIIVWIVIDKTSDS